MSDLTIYNLQTKEQEYYTTPHIINCARQVLGTIDLDPASCEQANKTVQADTYYTKENNGLELPWYGNVWLNPPYGKTKNKSNAGLWSKRLIEEYELGHVIEGLLLVSASMSYNWFHPLYKYVMCFPYKKLQFFSKDGLIAANNTVHNVIVYIGKDEQKFVNAFTQIGHCMKQFS